MTRQWRLFGIPIRIDPSWVFVAGFIAWSLARGHFPLHYPGLRPELYMIMGIAAAVLLFVCVLLHELGHSLAAKRFRIRVSGVTLFMFGGVSHLADGPRRPGAELVIALAGPLVSALLAAACFVLAGAMVVRTPLDLMLSAIVHYLAAINLGIILFNLLPGFPLDGGRVLRALLWAWTGDARRATRASSLVGVGFGTGLVALGLWVMVKGSWAGGLWYVMLGWFLRQAALGSYRQSSH